MTTPQYFITFYNTRPSPKLGQLRNPTIEHLLLEIPSKEEKTFNFQYKEYLTSYTADSKTLANIWAKDSTISKFLTLEKDIKLFIKDKNFSEETKNQFYTEFTIPKKNGGVRKLIKTEQNLGELQKKILNFLVEDLKILPHNAAHAFTKNRGILTNANVHKQSTWVIKMDIKNFFNSITPEILLQELSKLANINGDFVSKQLFKYALDELLYTHSISDLKNKLNEFLHNIIFLSTYKGELPQGSNLAPFFSNIIMTRFDQTLTELLQNNPDKMYYIKYTRYADDMTFSSAVRPSKKKLMNLVSTTLDTYFNQQLKLNQSKTQILKKTNKCFIVGVKLNKDNNITIGWEKKKQFKHDLFNLFISKQNNTFSAEHAQALIGYFSFFQNIEPEYAKHIERTMLQKFNSKYRTLSAHFFN